MGWFARNQVNEPEVAWSWSLRSVSLPLGGRIVDAGEQVRSPEGQEHEGEHADRAPGQAPSSLVEAPPADQQRETAHPNQYGPQDLGIALEINSVGFSQVNDADDQASGQQREAGQQ